MQLTVPGRRLRFTKREANEAVCRAALDAIGVKGTVTSTWDYDGMMRVDLTLEPGSVPLEMLALEAWEGMWKAILSATSSKKLEDVKDKATNRIRDFLDRKKPKPE